MQYTAGGCLMAKHCGSWLKTQSASGRSYVFPCMAGVNHPGDHWHRAASGTVRIFQGSGAAAVLIETTSATNAAGQARLAKLLGDVGSTP